MNCPKCNRPMTCGAPHGDGDTHQFECHRCGVYIGVGGSQQAYQQIPFDPRRRRPNEHGIGGPLPR
jgi:hypothetical protein